MVGPVWEFFGWIIGNWVEDKRKEIGKNGLWFRNKRTGLLKKEFGWGDFGIEERVG